MMRANSNVAVGASANTRVVSPPYCYPSRQQQESSVSNSQHRNEDSAYGPAKQDSSLSIAVPSSQLAISSTKSQHTTTKCGSDNNLCFPQRLFQMLNKIDQQFEHLSHIVSWHESGIGFLIHKPDSFVAQVLPIFFRSQTKLASFQRQLHNYGFKRIQQRRKVDSFLAYYHKNFLRDDLEECRNIELKRCNRLTSKSTGHKPFPSTIYRYNKNTKQVKEEHPKLLLKTTPKLCSASTSGALSKKVNDAFALSAVAGSIPPIVTVFSIFAHLNEGDKVLDEAAYAVYGTNAHNEEKAQEQGSTTSKDFFDSVYAASFWDPDIEALDFVLEDI